MARNNNSAATIGFESDLWRAADALRSNMDAAEYKHVVLGLGCQDPQPRGIFTIARQMIQCGLSPGC